MADGIFQDCVEDISQDLEDINQSIANQEYSSEFTALPKEETLDGGGNMDCPQLQAVTPNVDTHDGHISRADSKEMLQVQQQTETSENYYNSHDT